MSARQNKKQRKGRNSANNRERTVTTLTEDPNTPYLVPTPSEEPPASHLSAHLGSKTPMSSQPYQMSSNFGGFQSYAGTFNPQQQPYFPPSQSQTMQQQSSPQYPPLSPGKNDLEILQNLKQLILDNQHPVFRAVPQPAALAKLYKGPLPAQGGTESGETSGSGLVSATPDSGRLAARISSKDSAVPLGQSSGNQQNSPRNSFHNSSGNNAIPDSKALVHRIGKSVSNGGGSYSAGPDVRSPVLPTPEEDREGRYDYSTRHRAHKSDSAPMGDRVDYSSNGIKKQSLDDPMDETHGIRDNLSRSESWTSKQPHVYSESGRPGLDRNPSSRGGAAPLSAVASGQTDARSTPSTFDPPDNIRDRDGGPTTDAHSWSWQDRNHRRPDYNRPLRGRQQSYHRPRRMSTASDHHRPLVDDPPVRRGGSIVEPSQSHVPVDSRGPSTGVVRPLASSDRVSDESVVDSKRSVDYHPLPDARVPPLLSRVEGNAPDAALSARPSDTVSARAPGTASSDLASPDTLVQEGPSPRQSTNNTAGGGDLPGPPPRSNARPFPPLYHKKKFQKNIPHGSGPNNQGGAYGSPASDHPPPRSGQGRPPSPSVPMSSTSRPVHPRSSSNDGRRGRFPSPIGGGRVWDRGGPPSGRDISRDRPPASYRGDYEPDITPMRYGDTRSYGRDYSPPPSQTPFTPGERGPPGTYPSPSSGVAQGRDWGGYPPSYLPGNRRDWTAAEEEAYMKSRTWEGRPPPPPPSERDRYDYPPRSANWGERDYPGRDPYPPGPPPVEDRYNDRGRPPHTAYPPYNRVTRPRSPSPLRRGGPETLDDRPPVKRPREEYDPVEYYPPPPTAGRRGPGEYPPPRAGSPGPPPGSGASWPPPPASSGSSGAPPGGAGLPSDRDYRYAPPVSGGYDRPRSPGPPRGRPPYSRGGGYGRDGGRISYPPRP